MPVHAISVDGNQADPNTGDAPSSSPYLSYVALISQTGTDAPTTLILNGNDSNFLGEIVWTREIAGEYTGTLAGAFAFEKTCVFIQNVHALESQVIGNLIDEDTIFIQTGVGGVMADSRINQSPIEVRVYQN